VLRPASILAALTFAATAVGAGAKAPPRDAPVLDCRDRISGAVVIRGGETTPFRFVVRPRHDTTIGAVAFSGLVDYGRPASWGEMVRRDQWLKSIALVRPGARVTLVVPTPQRAWMRMEYGHGRKRAAHEVTLAGCRRPVSRMQQREECGPGPQDTCTSGRTPFAGGFTIDYARAPHQGRCARLIVWTQGERPRLERLFRPAPGECE
jgi:hypothetical protein